MENPLCTTKNVVWARRHIFNVPTAAELRRGRVRLVNLMDPQQTDLPQLDLAHLNCVAGGPYQVKLANGYITSIQVWQMGIRIILIYLTIIIRSKMLLGTMAKGSGGMTCQLTTMILVR